MEKLNCMPLKSSFTPDKKSTYIICNSFWKVEGIYGPMNYDNFINDLSKFEGLNYFEITSDNNSFCEKYKDNISCIRFGLYKENDKNAYVAIENPKLNNQKITSCMYVFIPFDN